MEATKPATSKPIGRLVVYSYRNCLKRLFKLGVGCRDTCKPFLWYDKDKRCLILQRNGANDSLPYQYEIRALSHITTAIWFAYLKADSIVKEYSSSDEHFAWTTTTNHLYVDNIPPRLAADRAKIARHLLAPSVVVLIAFALDFFFVPAKNADTVRSIQQELTALKATVPQMQQSQTAANIPTPPAMPVSKPASQPVP